MKAYAKKGIELSYSVFLVDNHNAVDKIVILPPSQEQFLQY